ncbi:MAG: PilZ domain-containing protein [Phycisphaerales bacterium]
MHSEKHASRERRQFPRTREARPCKVEDSRSGRFIAATTRDLSAGGVMVEAQWPTNIRPGDGVSVYLARDGGRTVMGEEQRTPARVVRVLRGDAVILALAFESDEHQRVRVAA